MNQNKDEALQEFISKLHDNFEWETILFASSCNDFIVIIDSLLSSLEVKHTKEDSLQLFYSIVPLLVY